jgi:hypothetical protein
VSFDVDPVREEAERLVVALFARQALVRAAAGRPSDFDPERAGRIAQAAGDVAVAVTGLLRELTRGDAPAGAGLRKGFAALATGLVEAAGVDLRGDPPPPEPHPWQATAEPDTGDVWRFVTRESQAQADQTHHAERISGDFHDRG